jgi:hypothetical protein
MALSDCSKEAVYLRRLLGELNSQSGEPVVIFNDNQSAGKLVNNPVFHSRTKHIDIRYHFVREAAESGAIDVQYLSTDEMPADILTKGLFQPKHLKFAAKMGLVAV